MAQNASVIDSVETLEAHLKTMREAQAEFAKFTQEQVDKIFYAAAIAANKARIPLAQMAYEETGYGVMEDKVVKNHYAAEFVYNKYKDTKTCGVIEDDRAFGMKKIAEPLGVVAAVIPTTNPTSTAIFKTLICLKTRNAIIISPHPRAKKCTAEAARVVRDAAEAAGCPKGIIDWIDTPSIELTNTLMQEADIILATGGPGMVNAAYSSGTPALGVGPGNNPAIIDDTADVIEAVNSIMHSKTFDNGMICATEQNVIVLDGVYDAVKAEFQKRGAYFLNDEEADKVGNTVIVNGGVNAKMVGQPATKIAETAGIEVPAWTKILIGETESVEPSNPWAHEKLTTILGKDPETVFCPNYYEEVGQILSQAESVGLTVPFLGGDGWDGLEGYATNDQLKDTYFCANYAKGSNAEFEDAYKAEYGQEYPNGFSPLGYDAAKTVVYGLQAAEDAGLEAGTDDYKQAVIDAIASGTIDGITGTFTFDEHHDPVKQTAILTYVDGKPVLKEMF